MADLYAQTHLGEDAELYALGSLNHDERTAADAHLAACEACRRRVGDAEETLLALERNDRPRATRRAPARLAPWAMIAAAFLLGLLPSLAFIFSRNASPVTAPHDAAIVAMVGSHFSHAQFATIAGEHAPPAKVIYARDGSWLYVLVAAPRRYEIAARSGATIAPLGATHVIARASEFFARETAGKVRVVYLLDDAGKPIAKASLITAR